MISGVHPIGRRQLTRRPAGGADVDPRPHQALEEPVVRAAVYAAMDVVAERVTDLLSARGRAPGEARVLARTLLFGVYFGALEQWHRDGRKRSIGDYAREAMAAVGYSAAR